MAKHTMELDEYLRKTGADTDSDFLQEAAADGGRGQQIVRGGAV